MTETAEKTERVRLYQLKINAERELMEASDKARAALAAADKATLVLSEKISAFHAAYAAWDAAMKQAD